MAYESSFRNLRIPVPRASGFSVTNDVLRRASSTGDENGIFGKQDSRGVGAGWREIVYESSLC